MSFFVSRLVFLQSLFKRLLRGYQAREKADEDFSKNIYAMVFQDKIIHNTSIPKQEANLGRASQGADRQ